MLLSEIGTPRVAEKRAPTTPLSLTNTLKRQLPTKDATTDSRASLDDLVPLSAQMYRLEVLNAKFQMWILEQQLAEERETREFLELERKAHLGLLE